MFNLVEKRRWFFLLSALLIIPGLLIMGYSWTTTGAPFRLSIDFVGGSIYDITLESADVTELRIREVYAGVGDENVIIQQLGEASPRWILRNIQTEGERDDVVEQVNALQDAASLDGRSYVKATDEGYLVRLDNLDTTEDAITAAFAEIIGDETQVEEVSITRWSVRGAEFQEEEIIQEIIDGLNAIAPLDEDAFFLENVSPTIGREVTRAALYAVAAASLVITGFIVFAFRQVPNAFRYGVCAIVAMLHDMLVVMGVMSLLGLVLGWEVDALFLTAVLTVVGFSVQDSIVVFDRIRENIPIRLGEPYETIVNRSLWETIHRSLATQLNAFFIMIAILLFGGDTVRQFIFILFIGLLSGSYSSLFTAVPLLVAWEKGEIPFLNQYDEFEDDEE